MDGSNGWGFDDADVRKLRLLDYIADNGQSPNVCTLPHWASDTTSSEYRDALTHLDEFNTRGMLEIYERGAAMPTLTISGIGMVAARKLREDRDSRRARTRGLRDALLYWLDEEQASGIASPVIDNFAQTDFGRWYGTPFPAQEIANATEWLAEQGFIQGVRTEELGIVQPSLLPKGQNVVDRESSVQDVIAPATVAPVQHTIWNVGPQSQIQHGDGNTINVSNVIGADQAPAVAALIETLRLLAQSDPNAAAADTAADEVEQSAQGTDRGRFSRALVQAQGAALIAIGTEAGQEIFHLTQHLLGQAI